MKNPDLLIVTPHLNSRLEYVLHYVFEQRMNLKFQVLNNSYIQSFPYPTLFYGFPTSQSEVISIPYSGYLDLPIDKLYIPPIENREGIPVIFAGKKSDEFLFDIFSAVFFMLTRIEEILSTKVDEHGRFDACHSFMHSNHLHHRALVDEWIMILSSTLYSRFPGLPIKRVKSNFSITMDIDQLFSYKGKGFIRNSGGLFRSFLTGEKEKVKERWQVFLNKIPDPFDIYNKLSDLIPSEFLPIQTFILASPKRTFFDKNTSFKTITEKKALSKISSYSLLGWHSSYYSQVNFNKFKSEKKHIENIIGQPVNKHRSHYLRIHIPKTYQWLVDCGITEDHSLGFACDYGFRAGTGKPFPFYDITQEKVLPLTIHPFCIMDGTLVDYLKLSLEESEEVLKKMWNYAKNNDTDMCILLHNETFSEKGRWVGWSNMLAKFFKYVQLSL
ncbi:MAG: hypothetical protein N2Z72_01250 [Bacteroidales bacterium]|nr:hypothetical protein [Bacteroidales bacterium]